MDNHALRRVVRTKRLIDAIDPVEVSNLRNRLEASRKAPNYSDRTHVDVPSELLDRILSLLEAQVKP